MFTVYAAKPRDYMWLVERTGVELTAGFRAIQAVDSKGDIVGMVGYSGWTEAAVQMHVAVDTPVAARALVRPAFEYPFLEAGKQLVIGITRSDNAAALKFNRHLGFRETYRIKNGWSTGVDLVVQELRRDECRWIRSR